MQKLLGNLKKGLVFVISAPSGTGKTTLVQMLKEEFPETVVQSISCTTRPPRQGEVDGKDYCFLTEKEFEEKIKKGEFLEHAKVFDYHYGTLKETVETKQMQGKHVLLVIDTQGAINLREFFPAHFIFIAPSSLEILKERLKKRNADSEAIMEERLGLAKHEMEQIHYYDYQIINDDLKIAYQVLKSIIIAEEHHLRR